MPHYFMAVLSTMLCNFVYNWKVRVGDTIRVMVSVKIKVGVKKLSLALTVSLRNPDAIWF